MSFHWQHHIASLILDLSSRSDSSYKKKLSQDHVLLIIALSPVHGLSSVICTHYVNFVSDNKIRSMMRETERKFFNVPNSHVLQAFLLLHTGRYFRHFLRLLRRICISRSWNFSLVHSVPQITKATIPLSRHHPLHLSREYRNTSIASLPILGAR